MSDFRKVCGRLHREGLVCTVHWQGPRDNKETGTNKSQGENGHGWWGEDSKPHTETNQASRWTGNRGQRRGVHRTQEGKRGGKRWVKKVEYTKFKKDRKWWEKGEWERWYTQNSRGKKIGKNGEWKRWNTHKLKRENDGEKCESDGLMNQLCLYVLLQELYWNFYCLYIVA